MWNPIPCIALMFLFLATVACDTDTKQQPANKDMVLLTDQQISSLASKRIFFGHQSVGDNILQGIRDLKASDPRLTLNLVSSADPETISGPAFIETHIGVNRNPDSKNDAFYAILQKGYGAQHGIALYKYCYIDFNPSTDVQQVFSKYRDGIASLKQRYPTLMIVHVTVPLYEDEPGEGLQQCSRTFLRRLLRRDPNIQRNEFNELLIRTYSGKEPIFDLAKVES